MTPFGSLLIAENSARMAVVIATDAPADDVIAPMSFQIAHHLLPPPTRRDAALDHVIIGVGDVGQRQIPCAAERSPVVSIIMLVLLLLLLSVVLVHAMRPPR
jgi:hypothetical protein